MGEKMITIRFDMGDFSGDGHEKTVPIYAKSSHSSDEIARAYKLSSETTGFILHKRVGCDYEDNSISKSALSKLRELGYLDEINDDFLTIEDIFKMFVFMVKLGNPNIEIAPFFPENETFFVCGEPDRNFALGYGLL